MLNFALEGIKVIDLTQVIMGPSCTAQLADHGAEVIKIEKPNYGDLSRQFAPYKDGESLPYQAFNRNKKSIAIDLKNPIGLRILHELIKVSDVIVNNFRPGVMDSLGLSYESARSINKGIIYACGTGFGLSGPLEKKMGHESVAQALGGLLEKNSSDGDLPFRIPASVADTATGHLLTVGILLALNARHLTNEGQMVDVSLLDSVIWMQGWDVSGMANASDEHSYRTNPLDSGVYKTKDGMIIITGLFRSNPLRTISEVIGVKDLSQNERFKNVEAMSINASELISIIQAEIQKKPSQYWEDEFEKVDIICAKILNLQDAINQSQISHNNMLVELKNENKKTKVIGIPTRLSETPGKIRTYPPSIGQHTDEVLLSLGISDQEIQNYREKKIIE
ncbi:CoA transferase [Dehalococcoidia bacterium]|nr:CoA transferase [Dehalococcoidia bacterium]